MMSASSDASDRSHLDLVHPEAWVNPEPAPRYDLVVIGGGTAGLVAAAGAAGLGARVALVERHRLGGDCLNTGCVPSKALISGARRGLTFVDAMARMRQARATLAAHDSAERFSRLGVDVFFGDARFDGQDRAAVAGTRLRFRRAVIATGARPRLPPVPGLAEASPLTSDTVFDLDVAPRRLAILGGGPMGCELAQAFQRLGVQVSLLYGQPRLLYREDPEGAALVERALEQDGVALIRSARVSRVQQHGDTRSIVYETAAGAQVLDANAILVASGRTPHVDGLGLDAAGVALAEDGGVAVDDFLRTSNPRIYACGDVCLPWKLTHAADATARIVVQNALFALGPIGRRRVSALTMAWCTYTDPEVAQTGLSKTDARERGIAVDAFTVRFADLDRAVTDHRTDGFVTVYTRKGTGTIVGATIAGPRAGDLISEVTVAMAGRVSLGALAGVIHPYPTYAEAIRRCGDAYNRARVTPRVRAFAAWWLRRSR